MPVKKEREYRTLVTPLTAQVASDADERGQRVLR